MKKKEKSKPRLIVSPPWSPINWLENLFDSLPGTHKKVSTGNLISKNQTNKPLIKYSLQIAQIPPNCGVGNLLIPSTFCDASNAPWIYERNCAAPFPFLLKLKFEEVFDNLCCCCCCVDFLELFVEEFEFDDNFLKISCEVCDGLAVNNAENQGFSNLSECRLNCKTVDNGCFVGKIEAFDEEIFKEFNY